MVRRRVVASRAAKAAGKKLSMRLIEEDGTEALVIQTYDEGG